LPDRLELEPGSFRDPANAVFYANGHVLRGLTGDAVEDWRALAATSFFPRLVEQQRVVRTSALEEGALDVGIEPGRWPLVLEHERIPFVSYPYEWTFSMLRDAAVLHLEILLEALGERMTMKDGYAFNVQWHGTQPTFVDIPSFERAREGEPWAGYKQFCQTFLFPLMLAAYKDVPFQPWLRGQVDGIPPRDMRNLMSLRDLARPGVFKHVYLHSVMESRVSATSATQTTKAELKDAGFNQELTRATVAGLLKLVKRLRWKRGDSHWADYQRTSTYTDEERERKSAFVREALRGRPDLGLVLDLGCNDGTYSRIAAEHAAYVVAVDSDDFVIDSLYRALRQEDNRRILPLTMNLVDPSPGLGWRGRERAAFLERARPAAVLCLALVHHLAITSNVPLAQIVDWLRSLGGTVIVEFVDPDDPQAVRLRSNKPAGMFADYRREVFEELLAQRFRVERREQLSSGTRALYLAVPDG
jgi:SAM-dependent methyltransferase